MVREHCADFQLAEPCKPFHVSTDSCFADIRRNIFSEVSLGSLSVRFMAAQESNQYEDVP